MMVWGFEPFTQTEFLEQVVAFAQFDLFEPFPHEVILNVKQGDTELDAKLQALINGVADDITGATITFSMRSLKDQTLKVDNLAATIVTGDEAKMAYAFAAADTDTVADYSMEMKVDKGSGEVYTVPNNREQKWILRVNAKVN